ncbi:MAG: hypothetical protein JWQ13_2800 [Ramlibacter sp.]|jgi:hypothetical protein|nr:hypothetical protein [Ramlibacter sp.]
MENTSGQGSAAVIPPEIAGWNWGAMLLNWIWGLGNRTYISLLMFVPFVNFVMFFVLGAKGNEWAWRNKTWDSVEHFKQVQRKWTIASLAVMVGFVVLIGVSVLVATQAMKGSDAYKEAAARLAADPQVAEALGTPVSTGTPSGSVSSSGGAGKADLSFEAKGPKARGTVYVDATEKAGQWKYNKVELEVEGRAERIVLGRAGAASAVAPAAPAAGGAAAPSIGPIILSEEKNATETEENFESGTARIYASMPMADVPVGSRVSAVWIAAETKVVAPDFVVAKTDVTLQEPVTHGNFDIAKPESGWPAGKYRLEMQVNGKVLASARFQVE